VLLAPCVVVCGHPRRHRGAPAGVEVQAELGAAPEDVVAVARPLARAQVARGLHEAELHYLQEHEWARSAEDVLWRRTKLGLHYGPAERAAVAAWCAAHWSDLAAPAPGTADAAPNRTETSWN